MIKAVIFDCFGVLLIDSTQSLVERYPEYGSELLHLRRQADAGYLSREDLLKEFSAILAIPEDEIDEIFRNEHQLNTQLTEYITSLKKSGIKIGMITNLGRGWFNELLPQKEVQNLFDDIIISGEVHMTKPSPAIYELSLNNLNVEADEAIFVDDIKANCVGAEVVGLKGVHYKTFAEFKTQMNV